VTGTSFWVTVTTRIKGGKEMKPHTPTLTLICLLLLCAATAHAQTVTLDNAINGAVDQLSRSLNRGSMVAALSMRTDSSRMASYLIDEIT
jgi:hypothetical protein